MPMLTDSDRLRYNRDEREIRQLQVGRGLHRRQMQKVTGEGVMDVFHSIGNFAGKAGNFVAKNKDTISGVTDSIGNIVKTGIQVGKEIEDLKRVQALRRATEEAMRETISTPTQNTQMSDDIFKNLRLQAEKIKKGNGMRKKGKGLFLS